MFLRKIRKVNFKVFNLLGENKDNKDNKDTNIVPNIPKDHKESKERSLSNTKIKVKEKSLRPNFIPKTSIDQKQSFKMTVRPSSSSNIRQMNTQSAQYAQYTNYDPFIDNDNLEIVPMNIKVNSTKIEKNSEIFEKKISSNLSSMTKSNFLLDQELHEKLRKLEDNLIYKNNKDAKRSENDLEFTSKKINTNALNTANSANTDIDFDADVEKNETNENNNRKYSKEQPYISSNLKNFKNSENLNICKNNHENQGKNFTNSLLRKTDEVYESEEERHLFSNMNNELIKKFDNLADIEDGMKKLNQILDFSAKSSLKFKIDQESNFSRENLEHETDFDKYDINHDHDHEKHKITKDKLNTNNRKNDDLRDYREFNDFNDFREPTPYNAENLNLNFNLNRNNPIPYHKPITPAQNTQNIQNSQFIPKTKSIETNKFRKVIDIDETKTLNPQNYSFFSNNTNKNAQINNMNNMNNINNIHNITSPSSSEKFFDESMESMDYLKNLLLKTKSDLDNLNKNLETKQTPNLIQYGHKKQKSNFSIDDEIEPRAPPKNFQIYN